jgi:signal transduction histidine kinase
MQGFAEVVMARYAQDLPEPGKDLLLRISSAAERLDHFIKESLTFHRGPREPLPLEPTELEPLVGALSLERPELAAPGTLDIRRPLLPVMAHPSSLAQALRHLFNNALQFVARGQKPQIQLWTEQRDGEVRICVKDNGIGIAPAHHEKVWNLFTRLHPKEFPGTGVGLPMVRRAIERMGGTTGVESQEGQGSLFWLQLAAL